MDPITEPMSPVVPENARAVGPNITALDVNPTLQLDLFCPGTNGRHVVPDVDEFEYILGEFILSGLFTEEIVLF